MKVANFATFVVRFRGLISLFFIVLVGALSLFLKDLSVDASSRIWFAKHSPMLQSYDTFLKTYGGDEGVIITFKNPKGIFNKKDLLTIQSIEQQLSRLPYFSQVYALSNTSYLERDPKNPDAIRSHALVLDIKKLKKRQLRRLKRAALKSPELVGHLISQDGTTTNIIAKLLPKYSFDAKSSIQGTQKIEAILSPFEKEGYTFYKSGAPFIASAFVTIATHDGIFFTALSIGSVFLLLFVMFRSFLGSLLALTVVAMTIIVVLSIQTLLGYQLNSFTANIPIFVVAIGIVHAIHVYWVWAAYHTKGHSSIASARHTIEKNFLPVFLTSFTTAIGFASLGISEIIPIRTLGFATASASMFAFLLSIVFVPALLSFVHYKEGRKSALHLINPKKYARFIIEHDKKIVAISLLLFLFFALGVSKVKVDNNVLSYFKPEHPIRQSIDFISKNISAPLPMEIIVDSGRPNGISDPIFLAQVKAFQKAYVAQFDEVVHCSSLLAPLNAVAKLYRFDNEKNGTLFTTQKRTQHYLNLYSSVQALNHFSDKTERYFRITADTKSTTTSRQLVLIDWAKRWWEKAGYSANVQGQASMFAYMQPKITETLIYSMSTALVLIAFVMLLILRDLKMLIYFLIPNLFPIITAIGVMGWLSIYVDMGVAISASIVLGIAVDDAIHFLLKYLDQIKRGHSVQEALEFVMHYTGGAIVLTSVILSVSFLELTGSSFMPNVYFALTTVSALIIALIADLLLLPALFSLKDKKRQRLTVDNEI